MFLGHFGVAFAAKRAAPRVSLGTLFAAALFLDVLWPVFVLLGAETFHIDPGNTKLAPLSFDSYPWSHSLLMTLLWSAAFGAVIAWRHRAARPGLVVGALVASHWVLDLVTHRPDLPLAPGFGTKAGFGLWNQPWVEIPLEFGIFIAGVALYATGTKGRDGIGRWAFGALAVVLVLLHVLNLTSPPPPGTHAVAVADLVGLLFIAWAAWVDRHRVYSSRPSALETKT